MAYPAHSLPMCQVFLNLHSHMASGKKKCKKVTIFYKYKWGVKHQTNITVKKSQPSVVNNQKTFKTMHTALITETVTTI